MGLLSRLLTMLKDVTARVHPFELVELMEDLTYKTLLIQQTYFGVVYYVEQ